MNQMKTFLGVVGIVSVIAGPALAADLPVKAPVAAPLMPVFNWTGWYIGANAGFGFGESTSTTAVSNYGFVDVGPAFPDLKPKGFIGGGQIGYDWQVTNLVFGVVADFQGADIKDSATVVDSNAIKSLSEKLDFLGTVRGRLGLAANNWLFYGSAGLAYGHVQTAVSVTETFEGGEFVAASTSENRAGWAAGAGVNYAVTPNWIIGLDYLHYDLGNASVTAVTTDGLDHSVTVSQKAAGDIVRGVINYRF